MSPSGPRGALAIVLHTHMPYVEGFGTWPFGEEWLWEAMAMSYLPLLELLDDGAPLTLSLTPVLCDQLEAPGIAERFRAFLDEVRRYTHEEDTRGLRAGGHATLAAELERSWRDYEGALERFQERGSDLLGALARHAQWTSSATHAVLPLLASDAGVRSQIQAGIESHRARVAGPWRGGFWLPECAYAPHLQGLLADAGVHAVCVELTDRLGLGAREHLRPMIGPSGVVLVPIDRQSMSLVWSEKGYPARGGYRDYHRHTVHHHNPWDNDGAAYDHERAMALARSDAEDFVSRVRMRLQADGRGLPGGGLVVCALDTELLGHWWYEGVAWLGAVIEQCALQGLELTRLDDALRELEPLKLSEDGAIATQTGSWGVGGDLSTWSGPAVADLAFTARAAELELLHAGPVVGKGALRELLALQASDWPFMVSRGLAVPYALERFHGHRQAFSAALRGEVPEGAPSVRNLAVHADAPALFGP
ncbi:MAG TPA: 1,4-alpha-glucan branching protein domain-containing protein [Solirubrobacteraceae bacterium]